MTIKPKFKLGQKVWKFYCNYGPNGEYAAIQAEIYQITVRIHAKTGTDYLYLLEHEQTWPEHMLHATEAEAFCSHAEQVQARYDREMALINKSKPKH